MRPRIILDEIKIGKAVVILEPRLCQLFTSLARAENHTLSLKQLSAISGNAPLSVRVRLSHLRSLLAPHHKDSDPITSTRAYLDHDASYTLDLNALPKPLYINGQRIEKTADEILKKSGIHIGNLKISAQKIMVNNDPVPLQGKMHHLFCLIAAGNGEFVSRQELMETCHVKNTQTLKATINSVRNAFKPFVSESPVLSTSCAKGFKKSEMRDGYALNLKAFDA